MSEMTSFLPLSACIEGLQLVSKAVFGVDVALLPLLPNESWMSTGTTSSSNNGSLTHSLTSTHSLTHSLQDY